MRIAVSGSIATDHLMVFPGRFREQLLTGSLDRVSLSFLADRLDVREGGVAANIAFGLGRLGLRPVLVGAVGADFVDRGRRLAECGVDTGSVRVCGSLHTARFICTTDLDQNQIATFYAGAMAEASLIDLAAVHGRTGGLDLVLVGADDPAAMLRHTATAHRLGISVAADPSQQLARLTSRQTRDLVAGASLLFTNEYERALLLERTGWSQEEVLDRVGAWLVTRGADGVLVHSADGTRSAVPAVPARTVADPTGVGDAFRAGFLAAWCRGLSYERASQLGCALATAVLGSVGTQEYAFVWTELLASIEDAYGRPAAAEIAESVGEEARISVDGA
ncbi:carbohydrate kinase family protein [Streptomyces canus]|uniref:carbohydrate kinase family protein n=1 Tax=Streptomyces canus TaxID=58343 RepID=UPI0022555E80|nr:carbohydrate kinase family protein [Streptomyces canus]MCX5261991.1 carbohydrate kinase family protein [Streptomyces canus]